MPVSGVLIIHNDCTLLRSALESVAPYIDTLVIVDGAYEWVAPFCKLSGEDPQQSTDELLDIVHSFHFKVQYHKGVWESETHKRFYSFDRCPGDQLILIDSDHLYELDANALDAFFSSGLALSHLLSPLYVHDDVVTVQKATNSQPMMPLIVNKRGCDLYDILHTLWLVTPDEEKGRKLPRSAISLDPIGTNHHLSLFRTGENPYRRSRFYNLLSMRMAKRSLFPGGRPFSADAEFVAMIHEMDKEAVDNAFKFHRIAAAFPSIKDNQDLRRFRSDKPNISETIIEAYTNMVSLQEQRTRSFADAQHRVFANRSMFFDITRWIRDRARSITVHSSGQAQLRLHLDQGCTREDFSVNSEVSDDTTVFHLPTDIREYRRVIGELSIQRNEMIVEFSFAIN